MKLSQFKIGADFYLHGKGFRCTDIGKRVVVAIPLQANVATSRDEEAKWLSVEETAAQGWLNGPPYAVMETVFDEDDISLCSAKA